MARLGFLSVCVFAIILAISTQQVFALKCWSCNNLAKFCDDPFDSSKFTDTEKLSLVDCTGGLCVKAIANITQAGKEPVLSVNRFCARTPKQAEDHCKDRPFESCRSCSSDECNGAQYGAAALTIVIPMAIAKIVLF